MILPFSTKFKDGTPTDFVNKIWQGLYMIPTEDSDWSRFLGRFWGLNKSKLKELGFENVLHISPSKIHTIREDARDRWHAGRLIHPVVFNRSKNQFQFAPAFPCVSVQKIEISSNPVLMVSESVKVDNRFLSYTEVEILAINDGFKSIVDFFAWFNEGYSGKIIHWTSLKY